MKNFIVLLAASLVLFCMSAFAQVDMEQGASLLKPVLDVLVSFLPENVVAIIIMIGGLRVLFKPMMALFEAFAIYTPSKKDDEIFKQINEGNTYKTIKFLLDFIASIKLPEKKK